MIRSIQCVVLLCAVGFFLCGACASPTVLHASRTMYSKNSMEKLAVFGESTINYPRWEGKGAIEAGLSKTSGETAIKSITSALNAKGYQVTYSRLAAVSYPPPDTENNERWVLNTKEGRPPRAVSNRDPVSVYRKQLGSLLTAHSLRYVFESEKQAFHQGTIRSFVISKDIAHYLGEMTNADTLCFLTYGGNTTSGARKAGNIMAGLVVGTSIQDDDITRGRLSCFSATTGELLWANEQAYIANPVNPPLSFFQDLLNTMPKNGLPMSSEVQLTNLSVSKQNIQNEPYPTVPYPSKVSTEAQPQTSTGVVAKNETVENKLDTPDEKVAPADDPPAPASPTVPSESAVSAQTDQNPGSGTDAAETVGPSDFDRVKAALPGVSHEKDFFSYNRLLKVGRYQGTFIEYKLYRTNKVRRRNIAATTVGAICAVSGIPLLAVGLVYVGRNDRDGGFGYWASGLLLFSAGLPLTIRGTIKMSRAKRHIEVLNGLQSTAAQHKNRHVALSPYFSVAGRNGGLFGLGGRF